MLDAADLDPDPFAQFGRWFDEAVATGIHEPTAVALGTADAVGRPVVRHVLLKGHGPEGFVFFTNYKSRKGQHLTENPQACLTFPWFMLQPGRQVIITGHVERLSEAESDAYFATRDRGSRLGAWASRQSEEIPDRAWLEARVAAFAERFPAEVPRPPHWGGYRMSPDSVEFWQGAVNRLHDRFRYTLEAGGWRLARLSP